MAVLRNDKGEARTKTLGVLVVIMVAAGVVALVLTLFGDNSTSGQAAGEPSGSQVGNQTSSTPATSAAASTPATSAPAATTPASTAPKTTAPKTTTPTTSSAPKPVASSPSTGTSTKVVKYTVKQGDNLTLISGWFSQRGYGLVYDWNKSVIGKNPNLIFPGQTIIVSLTGDKMSVTTKTK